LLHDHFVPEPFGEQLAPLVALTAAAGDMDAFAPVVDHLAGR
jgi:hypothetical protein